MHEAHLDLRNGEANLAKDVFGGLYLINSPPITNVIILAFIVLIGASTHHVNIPLINIMQLYLLNVIVVIILLNG